ncbi:MAG: hypothetical protein PHC61_04185 [Chitinivibrionales bacterium]|nr:hypothetical protein [Chitinivibrionales bacterium]
MLSTLIERLPAWCESAGSGSDDIALSTRIRLARNLQGVRFPRRASLFERTTVWETIETGIGRLGEGKQFSVVNFNRCEKNKQQLLVERKLATPELLALDGERGVFVDASCRRCVIVNEEDHIRLTVIDGGFCPDKLWRVLDALDTELGLQVHYAFDNTLGFLTACPTNVGTGMRVSFLLHLPALVLTKTMDSVLLGASQMGIATRGFYGEHSTVLGNLFQMSNQAMLGITEKECIGRTVEAINHIVQLERTARGRILTEAKLELTDRVWRAIGILTHARTLGVDEFLNCVSAVRLGVQCNIYEGTTVSKLNQLMLMIMPAHLNLVYGKALKESEERVARAEMVRNFFAIKRRTIIKKRTANG